MLEVPQEHAERGLSARCAVEVTRSLANQFADALLFAAIEPVAVPFRTGVQFERVTSVIEFVHRGGTDRACTFAGVRLVLNRAGEDDRIAHCCRFQGGEVAVGQPFAVAGGAHARSETRVGFAL